MLKIFSLVLFFLALGEAINKHVEITKGKLLDGDKFPFVTIEDPGESKTYITWNEEVTAESNPIGAIFKLRIIETKSSRTGDIKNLCEPLKDGSVEEVNRRFILKTIANTESCPIKKDTNVTYSLPYNYDYTLNMDLGCGKFIGQFIVYQKDDIDNFIQIISCNYGGTMSGC